MQITKELKQISIHLRILYQFFKSRTRRRRSSKLYGTYNIKKFLLYSVQFTSIMKRDVPHKNHTYRLSRNPLVIKTMQTLFKVYAAKIKLP